jgi:hypothetical protein
MYVTNPRGLDSSWWKMPARGNDKDVKVKGWQVLCYLKKLNKKGRDTFIIPPADKKRILALGKDQKVTLFQTASRKKKVRVYEHSDNEEEQEVDGDDEGEEEEVGEVINFCV